MQYLKTEKIMGNNIRRVRRSRHLTQEQLSAQMQIEGCDISRGTLAKIEAGIRHISLAELRLIKDILNMNYDDFFVE